VNLRRKTQKVLVVDDIKKWRDVTCAILAKRPDLQVTAQALDGLKALELARTLRPDILILDIGLPVLNGFEVARIIRQYSPASIIIFLSAYKSHEMISAALDLGANAFIAKTDVRQLLHAIDDVLAGRRFISKSAESTIAVPHELELFQDEDSLVSAFSEYVTLAIDAGKTSIVLVHAERELAIRRRLLLEGMDVSELSRSGRYIFVDVCEMLSAVMIDGRPAPARFEEVVCKLIRQGEKANSGRIPKVVICGESAPTLWRDGQFQTAIELERLWDNYARVHSLETFCGYLQNHDSNLERKDPSFARICSHHTAIRGLTLHSD